MGLKTEVSVEGLVGFPGAYDMVFNLYGVGESVRFSELLDLIGWQDFSEVFYHLQGMLTANQIRDLSKLACKFADDYISFSKALGRDVGYFVSLLLKHETWNSIDVIAKDVIWDCESEGAAREKQQWHKNELMGVLLYWEGMQEQIRQMG